MRAKTAKPRTVKGPHPAPSPADAATYAGAKSDDERSPVRVVGHSLYKRGAYWIADLYLSRPLPGQVVNPKTRVARVRRSTGCRLEDKAGAQYKLLEFVRQIEESGSAAGLSASGMTLARWCETWSEYRRKAGKLSWKLEQARLRDHVMLYAVARMPLRNILSADMMAWVRDLPTHLNKGAHRTKGQPICGRTCHNVANLVKQVFRDAIKEGLIPFTPCVWTFTDLPPKISTEAESMRALESGFTAEQVSLLIHDQRIAEDRRVQYALEFFTGLRTGEAVMRRFRDIQWDVTPRPRLVVATAWSSPNRAEGPTKTRVAKWIPIHRDLEKILRAWAQQGFRGVFGREPGPEDLIIPTVGGSTLKWPAGQVRANSTSWRSFQQDCATVGLAPQRHHETRSTFRSLALAAGADSGMLDLLTHPGKVSDARVFYNRLRLLWPRLCESVEVIEIPKPRRLGPVSLVADP